MLPVDANAERRAKRFWVSLVVGLLGLQLVIGGIAITLAMGDPSAAVIANYHAAALEWDATKREREAARRLGWTVHVQASDIADGRGMRALQLEVRDAAGQPVDDLGVEASIYRHARAGDIQLVELPSVAEGCYHALAPMAAPGLWQVNLAIDGASEPVQTTTTLEIPK